MQVSQKLDENWEVNTWKSWLREYSDNVARNKFVLGSRLSDFEKKVPPYTMPDSQKLDENREVNTWRSRLREQTEKVARNMFVLKSRLRDA